MDITDLLNTASLLSDHDIFCFEYTLMCYKYILFPSRSFIFESISFIHSNKILNYIASDNADTSLPDKHIQQSLSILLDLNSQIYPVVVTQGSPQPVIQYTFLKEQLTFTSVNLSSQELSVCHSVLWGELWLWACIR